MRERVAILNGRLVIDAVRGKRVMDAIMKVTGTKMKSQNAGKMGYTTSEVGDLVCAEL